MTAAAITRRAALTAAPALALTAAAPTMAAEPDPALAAIAAWERAWIAAWGERGACVLSLDDDDPEDIAACAAENAAHTAACNTTATSLAGLAAQLRFAFTVISGDEDVDAPGFRQHEPYSDLTAYRFHDWENGREGALLRNMLAAAERLAAAE